MAFPFPRKEMCRKLGLPQSPSSNFWTDDFTLFNELRDVQRASFLRRWTSYRYVPMWPEAVAKLCWQSGSPTKPWSFGRWWNSEAAASASCAVCLTDCCGKHGIMFAFYWSQYVSVLSGSYQRSHRFPYQVPSMLLRNTLHITAHHCTMLHVFSPFFSLARLRRNFHQAAASWVPQRDR
jgi:hypothetical protein